MDLLTEFHPLWEAGNYLTGSLMEVEELDQCGRHRAAVWRKRHHSHRGRRTPGPRLTPVRRNGHAALWAGAALTGRADQQLYRNSSILAMAVAPGNEPVMPELM